MQRQLCQRVIDGKPLAFTANATRIFPLLQFIGDSHNKHFGAMHMLAILSTEKAYWLDNLC